MQNHILFLLAKHIVCSQKSHRYSFCQHINTFMKGLCGMEIQKKICKTDQKNGFKRCLLSGVHFHVKMKGKVLKKERSFLSMSVR